MINIEPIKAFSDNYIWLVTTNEGSIVIDPGEADATIKFLKDNTLDLKAVLITHHHFDHTGGIADLISTYPVKVFGPKNDIPEIDSRVSGGDKINIIGIDFEIIEVPGHTLDHIAFYSFNNGNPILFCGDVLFPSGCGRVFEGTYEQMHQSLLKIRSIPENTKIYSGHEYTLSNLNFAKTVEPLNKNIISRYNEVEELRKIDLPSLPTTLELELRVNPFLRCEEKDLKESIKDKINVQNNSKEVFQVLREWKDSF